jgi:hypothetical protein
MSSRTILASVVVGLFVVGSFLGNAAFRADLAADDIDGYRRAAVVTIASGLVDVVGATPGRAPDQADDGPAGGAGGGSGSVS